MAIVTLCSDPTKTVQANEPDPEIFEEIVFFPSTGECLLLTPKEKQELDEYCDKLDQAILDFQSAKEDAEKIIIKDKPEEEALDLENTKESKLAEANAKLNTDIAEVTQEENSGDADNQLAGLTTGGGAKTIIEGMAFGRKKFIMAPSFFIDKVRRPDDNHSRNVFTLIDAPSSEEDELSDVYAPLRDEDGNLNKDKIKEAFKKNVKKGIKATWNLYKKEGQVSSKTLANIASPVISHFLKDENYEMVDKWVENFNSENGLAQGRKERKKEALLTLLEKDDFSIEEGERAFEMINGIWDKTDDQDDLKGDLTPKQLEDSDSDRKGLHDKIKEKDVPPVMWDYRAGAQLMRYTLGASADMDFDLKEKGKISAQIGAVADFALAEGKAEMDAYLPDDAGFHMAFNAMVRKQDTKWVEEPANNQYNNFYFHYNSNFVNPQALGRACQFLADKSGIATDEYLMQVVGHTDKVGSVESNQGLSEERAIAMYAMLVGDRHELRDLSFTKWGEEEKQYMLAAMFFLTHDQAAFKQEFIDKNPTDTIPQFNQNITKHTLFNSLTDEGERKEILIGDYYYPNTSSASAKVKINMKTTFEVTRINPYILSERNSSEIYNPFTIVPTNPSDVMLELVLAYRSSLLNYFEEVWNIKNVEKSHFFVHEKDLPYQHFDTIVGKGETQPVINTSGKEYRNRRVCFKLFRIDDSEIVYTKEDTNIELGYLRMKFEGSISAWAGANISVAALLNIQCPNGRMEMRGLGEQGLSASGEAIAVIKAEAGVKADLEWKNPEDKKPSFKMLGSVGYTVTGIAGASAAAEFKIGFDQESKRFQIKMKAQAAWGLGVGGSFSFTVGLNDLYDFVCMVHDQLMKQDFCFVDIFEGENDESRVDVFILFNAMCTHLLELGHPLMAWGVGLATNKNAIKTAAEFLENGIDKAREWKFKKQKENNLDKLAETILEEPNFIKRLTPEAKGRILYMLCNTNQSFTDALLDMWDGDINELHEDAAKTLIVNGIVSRRDWQETLEHMAIKDSNEPYVSQNNKQSRGNLSPDEMNEKSQRADQNLKRLKNGLFKNEPEKWKVIASHISRLK